MELYATEALSFSYPGSDRLALSDVSLSVSSGEFILLCGKSGCGKTTLLRLLKPSLSPFGRKTGCIRFQGREASSLSQREEASLIGFVMQSPDAQLVTDKVWHELAFGLESLGENTQTIRTRVAEMAAFFGIEPWFHKTTSELSGGQKQLLNLASVMVMQPKVLLLDEPTGQLDPIAAGEFFNTLKRVNRELGTTVILSEHCLEEAFPMADRVIVLSDGKVSANDTPRQVGRLLQIGGDDMARALPTAMRVSMLLAPAADDTPLSVREGQRFLETFQKTHAISPLPEREEPPLGESVIEARDVWFRYEKKLPDVLKGVNLTIQKGELFTLLGGNGAGKTTLLSLLCGVYSPYRGHVIIKTGARCAMLTQNPEALFCQSTLHDDFERCFNSPLTAADKLFLMQTEKLCHIDHLAYRHPFDLSGGELQRAALAKVLLGRPDILLLDEPTKGLDAPFKELFADILSALTKRGLTVLMVSHDIEFCAEYADRAALFFDGSIASIGTPRALFSGNSFYTTAAGRMAKVILPRAILPRDITEAFGTPYPVRQPNVLPPLEKPPEQALVPKTDAKASSKKAFHTLFTALFIACCLGQMLSLFPLGNGLPQLLSAACFAGMLYLSPRGLTPLLHRQIVGWLLFALYLFSCLLHRMSYLFVNENLWQLMDAVLLSFSFITLSPPRPAFKKIDTAPLRSMNKSLFLSLLIVLLAVPFTLFCGIYYFNDRNYYLISLLIIFETLIPFLLLFESRRPKARELVLISTVCALAIAGRTAFFMLPQFKPVIAILIVTGLCFGAEIGFLTGAVTGFISNFFFGQGPWTPWQMFGFAVIGCLSGFLLSSGRFKLSRPMLCAYGFFMTLVVYGGLVNLASALIFQPSFSMATLLSVYAAGFPLDMVHALSTSFFLWFMADPLFEKLHRIKTHYGLLDET